jgi:hypothetical protein
VLGPPLLHEQNIFFLFTRCSTVIHIPAAKPGIQTLAQGTALTLVIHRRTLRAMPVSWNETMRIKLKPAFSYFAVINSFLRALVGFRISVMMAILLEVASSKEGYSPC